MPRRGIRRRAGAPQTIEEEDVTVFLGDEVQERRAAEVWRVYGLRASPANGVFAILRLRGVSAEMLRVGARV